MHLSYQSYLHEHHPGNHSKETNSLCLEEDPKPRKENRGSSLLSISKLRLLPSPY
jgi:hypothetical protein